MLNTPEYGWTEFKLGEKTYQLSYITNVAKDWLTTSIYGLENIEIPQN